MMLISEEMHCVDFSEYCWRTFLAMAVAAKFTISATEKQRKDMKLITGIYLLTISLYLLLKMICMK